MNTESNVLPSNSSSLLSNFRNTILADKGVEKYAQIILFSVDMARYYEDGNSYLTLFLQDIKSKINADQLFDIYIKICLDGLLIPDADSYGGGSDAIRHIDSYRQIDRRKSEGKMMIYLDENGYYTDRFTIRPVAIDVALEKIFEAMRLSLRQSFERGTYSNTRFGQTEMNARLFGGRSGYVFNTHDIFKVFGDDQDAIKKSG